MAPDNLNEDLEDDDNPGAEPSPEAQAAADAVSHKRIWEDPIPAGDLVPFDPQGFQPKLTPEQRKAILEGE
jgi:hypothetical protein